MIDEKKLIEEMEKITFTDEHQKKSYKDLLEHLIQQMPKVGEWIPCSKELPIGRKVLLQTEKGQMTVAILDKKMNWYSDSGDGWCTDIDVKPIAWMPLPEPCKER